MITRINKLIDVLTKKNLDGMIITDAYNRRYISGFTGSSGYLYVSKNKKVMVTDFRYIEQATNQCVDYEIIDYASNGLIETINQQILDDGAKKVAFEANDITYKQFLEMKDILKGIELVDTKDIIEEIRMIKDEEELACIKKAASIGDQAFSHILSFLKEGISERDVALELEFFMRKHGATKLSFDTIAASGKNSSLPHAHPTDKKLENGDFLTMDFGCVYKGYCSDMTRTVVIGKANEEQKKIYHTVLKAQLAALEGLKAGLTGEVVDKIARDIIYEAGYEGKFGHGLGHSVGLYIHEEPRLSPKGTKVLKENMIVTVEPGIYIPQFGGVRIEDQVCVKENGYINFTDSNKELIEI